MLVRPVHSGFEIDAVRRLHHDAWGHRGFIAPRSDGRIDRHREHDLDPDTCVLVARRDRRIVGTCSLTVDGPRRTPIDHGLEASIASIRSSTRRLAAGWRIATTPSERGGRAVVMGLVRSMVRRAIERDVSCCVFFFHVRHVRIYADLIGARVVHHVGSYYADAPTWDCTLMRVDEEDWGAAGFRGLLEHLTPRRTGAGRADRDSRKVPFGTASAPDARCAS